MRNLSTVAQRAKADRTSPANRGFGGRIYGYYTTPISSRNVLGPPSESRYGSCHRR
jgi:hypothetical protein